MLVLSATRPFGVIPLLDDRARAFIKFDLEFVQTGRHHRALRRDEGYRR